MAIEQPIIDQLTQIATEHTEQIYHTGGITVGEKDYYIIKGVDSEGRHIKVSITRE